MKILGWVAGAVFVFLGVFMLLTSDWDRPPIADEQTGYRGTGMVDVVNPRERAAERSLHEAPEAPPKAGSGGPKAGDIYQNVKVLDDLSAGQFTRLMQSMTDWVAPEEGCTYCHEAGNFASEDVYTKKVSRRMLQMTRHINAEWTDHVQQAGVTCYTCHRGNNVPQYTWVPDQPRTAFTGMAGNRDGQNAPDPDVGLSSLPGDPFSTYLAGGKDIRVAADTGLPVEGESGASIQMTEDTYGLMMHMSQGLGVNCTYCHNSRAFRNWEQSNPARVTAWHGIRMARSINNEYVAPLASVLPDERKGPQGNAKQVNCTTCHQGINKPLYGAQVIADFPSLVGEAAGAGDSETAAGGGDGATTKTASAGDTE